VGDVFERVAGIERAGEAQRGSHRSDGVRAGGADADLEEFEEAGIHGDHCRRGGSRLPSATSVQANGTALGAIFGEHSTASRTHQALFKARSAAYGIDAHLIDVEVDFSQIKLDKEIFITVGLPDAAMRESRDRVKSAIRNSGFEIPPTKIRSTLLLRT
jgi:hypothetical protein